MLRPNVRLACMFVVLSIPRHRVGGLVGSAGPNISARVLPLQLFSPLDWHMG